ncbi:hypothetical protein NN561_006808 [Cricetulus griseus]
MGDLGLGASLPHSSHSVFPPGAPKSKGGVKEEEEQKRPFAVTRQSGPSLIRTSRLQHISEALATVTGCERSAGLTPLTPLLEGWSEWLLRTDLRTPKSAGEARKGGGRAGFMRAACTAARLSRWLRCLLELACPAHGGRAAC